MNEQPQNEQRPDSPERHFQAMVESVGVKKFAAQMGLSTRQINRMLSGAQPNPVERMIRCLEACDPEIGDRVLDYVCQEMGGIFVREESMDAAILNAIRECAEAIAVLSDGHLSGDDESEVRQAVQALMGAVRAAREHRRQSDARHSA